MHTKPTEVAFGPLWTPILVIVNIFTYNKMESISIIDCLFYYIFYSSKLVFLEALLDNIFLVYPKSSLSKLWEPREL